MAGTGDARRVRPANAAPVAVNAARFEVLAGWRSQDLGWQIWLRTETFEGGNRHRPEDPIQAHLFMTHEEGTLLANYLFLLTGQSRPEPRCKKKSWFGGR